MRIGTPRHASSVGWSFEQGEYGIEDVALCCHQAEFRVTAHARGRLSFDATTLLPPHVATVALFVVDALFARKPN